MAVQLTVTTNTSTVNLTVQKYTPNEGLPTGGYEGTAQDLKNEIDSITIDSNLTGWASYADTLMTSSTPFAVLANTDTLLPNNKGNTIETQKPSDIDTFYDGTVIKGRTGDGILITIDIIIVPTEGATTYLEVWFDITGGTGLPEDLANLYRRIVTFPKGNGQIRSLNFTVSGYTLNTWEANGAVVKVRSNGNCNIYNIRYVISRTHKAK